MFRMSAQTPHFSPQAEGPELIELDRHARTESADVRLETVACQPSTTHDVKRGPKPEVPPKPGLPPKPGVKPMIYIEVVPNEDPNKGVTHGKQKVASKTEPDEKVIYFFADPVRTAAFKKSAALEMAAAFEECAAFEEPPADRPPPSPCRPRSSSPRPQAELTASATETAAARETAADAVSESGSITSAQVPDEAKRALERTVSTLIQDLARARPAGPFKVFKSKDSYGSQRAMREFGQAFDSKGFKEQMREYGRQFPRTGNMLMGARRAATEELAAMTAAFELQGLSGEQRETLKRHVERTGGLGALDTMLGKARRDGWIESVCDGMRLAFQDFLTERVGNDA